MSSNNADISHDVILKTSDGLRVGLMLARPVQNGEEGAKAWHVEEIPTPTNVRVTVSGVGVADQPPEMQAIVYRDDNSGGMGVQNIAANETVYRGGTVATSVSKKIVKPPSHAEITLPTSEGKVRVMFDYKGATYVSDGRYLHRSGDGVTFTQVMDAGSGKSICDGLGFGASDGDTGVVVAVETEATRIPVAYWFSDVAGTTFTQATDAASRQFNRWAVHDQTLYGFANPNEMRTSTDPFVVGSTFTAATQVGDELHFFQSCLVVAGVLVICKEDRIFTVDATGAVGTLVGQFASTAGLTNFPSTTIGLNSNVYSTVGRDVWEYNPIAGDIRPLGISRLIDTQYDLAFTGVQGLAYDPEGALFTTHFTNLTLNDEDDQEVFGAGASIVRISFGAERDVNNLPKVVTERWLQETTSGYRPRGPYKVSEVHSTLTTGRHLYFNTDTAGKIGRMNLWRAADPTLDTQSTYELIDSVYQSGWMHHNFPTQIKDYTMAKIDLLGVTAQLPGASVDAYYYLDGDMSVRYELQLDMSTSKLYTLEFGGVSSRAIMLELVLHTDSASMTPQVLSWAIAASVKFDFREIMELGVKCSDHPKNRKGGDSEYTAKYIRAALRSMRDSEDTTIDYQDYRGYHFTNVKVLPGFKEADARDENGKLADYTIMTFRIMRVSDVEVGIFIVDSSLVAGPDVVAEG